MAFFMMSSSKKGISAHQLHRMLKMTYRSAWFMCHRIRHAMNEGPIAEMLKGTVEIDETYVGGKPRPFDGKPTKKGRGTLHKTPVVALIQRNGDVRTKVVSNVSQKNLRQFVGENIEKGTVVNTDSFAMYHSLLWPIYRMGKGRHDVVNHKAKEYARHNLDGSVARNSDVEVYTSMITVSECTHIEPGKPQPAKKVQEFFDQLLMSGKSGVLLVQLTARINDISKDLRWKDKLSLRGMDAIHLATAIDKCCCEMITTDGKLKNCPAHHRGIKIIQASDTKELPSKYDNWELEDYAKSKGKT
jgi:predicted nucleic acid-binding protein